MCPPSSRARAALVLAVLLLPPCALAEPLRLQLAPFTNEVPTAKALQPATMEGLVRSGLAAALKKNPPGEFVLLPPTQQEADILISGTAVRVGKKYRLTCLVRSTGTPPVQRTLDFDLPTPQLPKPRAVVLGKALLDEARKVASERGSDAPAPVAGATPEPAATATPPPSAPTPPPEPEGLPTPKRYRTSGSSSAGSSEPDERSPSRYTEEIPNRFTEEPPSRSRDPEPRNSTSSDEDTEVAQRPRSQRAPGDTRLDIGASGGFNSPAGVYGGEVEYRPFSRLGVNVSGGSGAWGIRVGPLLRLYPFGHTVFSPFLEAGMSFNLGQSSYTEITSGGTTVRREWNMLFTPVPTGAVGARVSFGRYVYFSARAGWAFNRLVQDNFKMKDGMEPDLITAIFAAGSQHYGFLISGTLGVSVF